MSFIVLDTDVAQRFSAVAWPIRSGPGWPTWRAGGKQVVLLPFDETVDLDG